MNPWTLSFLFLTLSLSFNCVSHPLPKNPVWEFLSKDTRRFQLIIFIDSLRLMDCMLVILIWRAQYNFLHPKLVWLKLKFIFTVSFRRDHNIILQIKKTHPCNLNRKGVSYLSIPFNTNERSSIFIWTQLPIPYTSKHTGFSTLIRAIVLILIIFYLKSCFK